MRKIKKLLTISMFLLAGLNAEKINSANGVCEFDRGKEMLNGLQNVGFKVEGDAATLSHNLKTSHGDYYHKFFKNISVDDMQKFVNMVNGKEKFDLDFVMDRFFKKSYAAQQFLTNNNPKTSLIKSDLVDLSDALKSKNSLDTQIDKKLQIHDSLKNKLIKMIKQDLPPNVTDDQLQNAMSSEFNIKSDLSNLNMINLKLSDCIENLQNAKRAGVVNMFIKGLVKNTPIM